MIPITLHAQRSTRRIEAPLDLHLSRRQRLQLVGEGALVGLAGGMTIAFYRFALSHAEELLRLATTFLRGQGLWFLMWFVVLAILCFAVGWLVMFEPFTQGSGIPQIDAEVAGRISMPWHRVLPIKFIEGTLCALAGLSLGREGPSVQLGGMAGKGVSKALGKNRNRERLLITCGAASGMSAAFHAPLTGVLFAIEEIHKEFSASLVISVMTASVVADFVSSHVLGVKPLIQFGNFATIPHQLYLFVLLLGVVCGLAGAIHNRGMFFLQDRVFGPLEQRLPYVRYAVPFALAGVMAFVLPDLMCGGDAIVERIMHVQGESLVALVLLLVGKYLFTAICFASGAPGGTLFPLVVMGSLFGAIYGICAMQLGDLSGAYQNSFIVLGMAGLFASVIQAPVTAVVLVFELTGSLEALLATTIVSIISYVVSGLTKNEPFYEHLYDRLVGNQKKGSPDLEASQGAKSIHTYVIGPGSAVEGHEIREIHWPEGALVVTVRHAGIESVAKGNTRLEALDEILVIMSGGGSYEDECHIMLRRLCVAPD